MPFLPWNNSEATVPDAELPLAHLVTLREPLALLSLASQVALVVKNLPANAGDSGDAAPVPGLGRSPGGGYGNTLLCSCLENPMDRGTWGVTVHGVAKESDTTEMTWRTHSHIVSSMMAVREDSVRVPCHLATCALSAVPSPHSLKSLFSVLRFVRGPAELT